jgi:hypothetical protein
MCVAVPLAPLDCAPWHSVVRDDKKRIHVTEEVFSMLSQTAAELNRAQRDFGKGKLVDGWASGCHDTLCQ